MKNVRILKSKEGDFYLLAPGISKIKIEKGIDHAWARLNEEMTRHRALLEDNGLADEQESFSFSKLFGSAFWIENLFKGIVVALPLFLILFLFSLVFVRQVSKLGDKLAVALDPLKQETIRQKEGFKGTVERYRPYIYETLKVIEEEKLKVESETGKGTSQQK